MSRRPCVGSRPHTNSVAQFGYRGPPRTGPQAHMGRIPCVGSRLHTNSVARFGYMEGLCATNLRRLCTSISGARSSSRPSRGDGGWRRQPFSCHLRRRMARVGAKSAPGGTGARASAPRSSQTESLPSVSDNTPHINHDSPVWIYRGPPRTGPQAHMVRRPCVGDAKKFAHGVAQRSKQDVRTWFARVPPEIRIPLVALAARGATLW